MTTPRHERIVYAGQASELYCYPLEAYLDALDPRPEFDWRSSCHRGYVGHWEIADGWLYLTSLNGRYLNGRCLTMAVLFSGSTARVRADWYSGALKFGHGKPTGSTILRTYYQWDIVVAIERGRVAHEGKSEGEAFPQLPEPEVDLETFLARCRAGKKGLPK